MVTIRTYKDRLIDARILPVRTGGWTAHFSVLEERGSGLLDNHVETGLVFESEKDALEFALRAATQKIDATAH
jgi:hypothetical protein